MDDGKKRGARNVADVQAHDTRPPRLLYTGVADESRRAAVKAELKNPNRGFSSVLRFLRDDWIPLPADFVAEDSDEEEWAMRLDKEASAKKNDTAPGGSISVQVFLQEYCSWFLAGKPRF